VAAEAGEASEGRMLDTRNPKNHAAAVAAVADRFVRELVLSNVTSHEHSAALEALFREAASKVAAAAAADGGAGCGGGWRLRRQRLARNSRKVRPPRTLPRALLPILSAL
jgi:hypothetical protein